MSKFVVLSLVFSFSLIADTLSLRYSPKNFDYIFSANPNSISQVPIVADFLIKKYEEQAKSNWCKELGIDIENMSSFSFTANLSKFLKLKSVKTPEAQLERIQQWLMFIEFRTAPNLALMTEKYEQRKAAGKNRMNIQKSEIAGYPVYLILFKQRTYCYAQLSGTRWIAGEKETVSLALDLNEVDSLKANEVFVEEMESNKSSLMFSLHDPKGNVEIAHPSFKTYKGHYSKLSYSDDFVYDFSLSMDNQVDLQGVESFIRMMSNFAFAKPELKMSAENIITSLTDGNLDISVRASAENIKSIFAHMKSKWAKKRSYNKSKACTEKKCDKSDLLIQ